MATSGSDDARRADAAALTSAKRVLRDAVRLRRAARSADQRERDDALRFERLRALLLTARPRRIAAYLSTGDEPDTLRLVAWAATHGIEVLLPVLSDGHGAWRAEPGWARYAGPDSLREGRAGILEPTTPPVAGHALTEVDVMVLPGLAADQVGNRLGRGGGWYDRARMDHRALPSWLLLNDDEVLEAVPTQPWDLPVDLVITPTRDLHTG